MSRRRCLCIYTSSLKSRPINCLQLSQNRIVCIFRIRLKLFDNYLYTYNFPTTTPESLLLQSRRLEVIALLGPFVRP